MTASDFRHYKPLPNDINTEIIADHQQPWCINKIIGKPGAGKPKAEKIAVVFALSQI